MQKNNNTAVVEASEALAAQLENLHSVDAIPNIKDAINHLFLEWNSTQWANHEESRVNFQSNVILITTLLEAIPQDRAVLDGILLKLRGHG